MELVEDGADAFGQEKLLGDTGICETACEKLHEGDVEQQVSRQNLIIPVICYSSLAAGYRNNNGIIITKNNPQIR